MDDLIGIIGQNFSFTEILCFCLLWRIEGKLAATTEAINKLLAKVDADIVAIKTAVDQLKIALNQLQSDHQMRINC